MINQSRKSVRKAFASLLSAALVGTGKLAQIVTDYRWGTVQGESPVVVVSSDGTLRTQFTFQGSVPVHRLQVDVFVLYSTEDTSYTEATAEDLLDDIEQTIAATVDSNQRAANWEAITEVERSVREDIQIAGVEYIREYLVLEFS